MAQPQKTLTSIKLFSLPREVACNVSHIEYCCFVKIKMVRYESKVQLAYAACPFFVVNQLFSKASIFALYYRIFNVHKRFVVCASILAILQVCWFIAFFFSLIFLCVPVSKFWDVLGEKNGWCVNDAAWLAAEETINSCIDFAMVILSAYMIQKLNMKRSTKRKLGFLFALGGLSGVIGFVKIGEVYAVPDKNGSKQIPALPYSYYD